MAWYHIVLLNLETKTAKRVIIERSSMAAALADARAAFAKRRGFTSFELWQRGRLLHREGRAAPAPRLRRLADGR